MKALLAATEAILTDPWDSDAVPSAAGLSLDVAAGGRASQLLKADTRALWATWLLESLDDPQAGAEEHVTFLSIYARVLRVLRADPQAPAIEESQLRALARQVAACLQVMGERRRSSIRRQAWNVGTRSSLVDLAGRAPRCWICGFRWSPAQIAAFIEASPQTVRPRVLVDFVKPVGGTGKSMEIQVEHVLPLAAGGNNDTDNLRLACGWCNLAKGKATSLYDFALTRSRGRINHPKFGSMSLPPPSLVVRIMALEQRCHSCARGATQTELTVDWSSSSAAPNPLNCRPTCYEHDRFQGNRLVARPVISAYSHVSTIP